MQPTATEFVPNQNKQEHRNFVNTNKSNNRSKMNKDNRSQETVQAASVPYEDKHEDNRVKYNDRKFENKRDAGKRWRDTPNGQFYKDDRKEYGRNQNPRRAPNDRYNYNRNFSDRPRNNRFEKNETDTVQVESNANSEIEKTLTGVQNGSNTNNKSYPAMEPDDAQSTSNQSLRNSKSFSNNSRGDRYYDRKERYNPRDPRDRRSNYPENNGYNRNNYNRDNKYEKRNYRENTDKEFTDWRLRTDDPVNKAPAMKRSHYKKYEPGNYLNFQSSLNIFMYLKQSR